MSIAWGLPSDSKQPYEIKADHAIYDRNQHITSYIGNVQVVQGSSQLESDKAIVYQDNNNFITHVVAFGNFAHYSTLPEPGKDRMHAYARSIDYNPSKKIVWLIGDGHVNEGGEFFSGPHIWYNMENGLVRSTPQEIENMTTSSPTTPSTPMQTEQRTIIVLPDNRHRHETTSPTATLFSGTTAATTPAAPIPNHHTGPAAPTSDTTTNSSIANSAAAAAKQGMNDNSTMDSD